jgi:4-amino-4-deoxy-L-arabinose transferase-like glycosyltransferase
MTYLLTRFGVSSALAAVSSLYFVSTPDFYHWSQSIHPDVLQTFLILATFTVLTRSHSLFSVFLATAIGGLAFGTKYAGIFLLPFLPLPYALRVYQAKPSVRASVPAVALAYLLTASIFLIVFLSVNPYVVTHFTAAWADFTYESRHVKIGDTKVESPSPLLWIPVLTGEFGIWGFVLVLAGFSILVRSELQQLFAQGASKYFSDMNRRTKITLILYSTCCLLYLFSMVRMRVPRFLFHVSPIIVVLSTLGYWDIVSRIRPNWIKTKLIPSMLFLLLIPSLMSTLKSSREYSDKANSPLLKQGQFLLQHFDSKARILSNPYAYVPSVFENVEFRYSIAQDDIRRFKPDVIILTQSAHGRWSWKKDKTSLSQQDFYLNQGYPEAPAAKEFLEWITSSVGDYRIAYESEWCGVFKPN